MPTVKIELKKGRIKEELIILRNCIANEIIKTLQLPENDKNIRILEYDSELFTMKAPYEILIEITMFSGRSKETKKLLFKNITESLENYCGVEKNTIMIIINEQPLENWGVRGGIPADEIKLDFKVNI